jgi:ATP-dependent DNA ligase
VIRFAHLLDRLSFEHSKNAKLRLLAEYFRTTPDPDRGFALAALTGGLAFRHAKPSHVRALVSEKVDPVLFDLSLDYVGDLAETVALIWPARELREDLGAAPRLSEIVVALESSPPARIVPLLEGWLDNLDASGRWALIKLIAGALRVGASRRLAEAALAEYGGQSAALIEEVSHSQAPPYEALFAWLDKKMPRPAASASAFTPVMLAQALDARELDGLDPKAYRAEWKWDGIRVQIVGAPSGTRLYARSGDEVTKSFPELAALYQFDAVLDGELLIVKDGVVAPFADLQRRLHRKTVSPALARELPVAVRLYDILFEDGEDTRPLPFDERRRRLEAWYARAPRPRLDLSPLIPFERWEDLALARASNRAAGIEGIMIKRKDSSYVSGRPKGPWFKWKRDPFAVDAVLMYAQRGHGKRSSYYSDYTFGVWKDGELVPVGKAYFGFTDAELAELDRWIRGHTIGRFGPVREVEKALVLEVAFEGLQRSNRHKSGLAMRFPRIARIRWDKPAAEADPIESLLRLIEDRDGATQE